MISFKAGVKVAAKLERLVSPGILCAGLVLTSIILCERLAGAAVASAPDQSTVRPNPIQQIAWMVGGVWLAEEKTDGCTPTTMKLSFYWGKTKNSILYNLSVGSGANWEWQYDGMFVWRPDEKKIKLLQVDDKGEVAEGQLLVNSDEIEQTVRSVHPNGGAHFLKTHYTRVGADSFRIKAYTRSSEAEEWKPALDLLYRRRNPVTAATPQPSVTLPAELQRVLTDYENAWSKGDHAALARLFTEDGFEMPAGSPLIRGREAIRRGVGPGGPLSLRALSFSTNGDVGYIIGAFGDQVGAPDRGKFTLTLRREATGRWLIVSDMDN